MEAEGLHAKVIYLLTTSGERPARSPSPISGSPPREGIEGLTNVHTERRRTPGIERKPTTPIVNIVAAFIYSPSRGLAPAIAALGATKFRAPGLRPTGPEIELSFFETTPSGRESGGNIQNLMLYATPKLSPFLSKQNPQYSGRNRLLAGTVFLAAGNNILQWRGRKKGVLNFQHHMSSLKCNIRVCPVWGKRRLF